MKLATLNQGRDGVLVVVSRDLARAVKVPQVAATLQAALDDWQYCKPKLEAVYQRLNDGLEEGAFAPPPATARCRVPITGPTAAPTSITSSWCARRVAPRCRSPSGTIR